MPKSSGNKSWLTTLLLGCLKTIGEEKIMDNLSKQITCTKNIWLQKYVNIEKYYCCLTTGYHQK